MPANLPSKQRSSLFSFSLKTLGAAVMSAMLLSNAAAAGLGKLTVLSSLGQPLNAEIELNAVSKEEAATLVPKLAPPEAFRAANIELHPALLALRFTVEQRGDRQIIRVTSTQAMNEPFVDMLLEVGIPNGRLVREYTFLLDPPDMRATQSPQVAATPAQGSRSAPTEARLSLLPKPGLAPLPSAAPATAAAPVGPAVQGKPVAIAPPAPVPPLKELKERQVRRGETLSQIARENQIEGISLDQMLVALYRTNPDAFIGKNMNRMRSGAILVLPDADNAASTSTGEAHRVVIAQANDFNEYRNQLAGQVDNAEAKAAVESKNTASGKITAKVAEAATPADEAKDKLKLSKSVVGSGAEKASGPADSAEDKIARDKAQAEASARVKELERIVNDLQKVAELKNKDLAERQKAAEAEQARVADAAKAAAPASASASATAAAPASIPAKTPPVAAAPAAKPAPGFFDDPLVLPGIGLLLTLIGSLGFIAARRKRQAKQFDEHAFEEPGLDRNSIFNMPGGQRIDTHSAVFNSSFASPADPSVMNEVDPIAEADVYIAYGRDAQAEEILNEALRINPDRHPVRIKLLEIHANRKDKATFATVAKTLHDKTGGAGEFWIQAAALGLALDPDNPLYAAKAPVAPASTQDAGPATAATAATADAAGAATEDLTVMERTIAKAAAKAATVIEFYPDPPADKAAAGADEADATEDDVPANAPPVQARNLLASDINDINFDFLDEGKDKQAGPAPSASPAKSVADLEDEFAQIESEFAKSAGASANVEPAPIEFDLSDITLELSPQESAPAPANPEPAAVPELEGIDALSLDVDALDEQAEMVTKLDLASAYEEIGDKEGARELLEEVIAGGTPEQVAKAKALLERLA